MGFGVNEVPGLSNSIYAASPPLVVVGGITFIVEREAFWSSNLSASSRPDVHYNGNLVEETRGGRRVTRAVRVLWVDTNKESDFPSTPPPRPKGTWEHGPKGHHEK